MFKIFKIMTTTAMVRKKMHNVNWHCCKRRKNKYSDFPTCVKLGVGSRSGSASNGKSDTDRHRIDADPHH
jgi:hypothetical protein